jgi:hypothetical protein
MSIKKRQDIKDLINKIDIYTLTYKIVANICAQITLNDPEHPSYEITKSLILTNMYELLKMCDAETRNMVMIGIPGSMWNNYMLEVTKKFKVHEKLKGGGNTILKLLSLFYIVTTVTQATILTTKTKVENTVKEALLNPGHISAFKNTHGICVANAMMGGIFATTESIEKTEVYVRQQYSLKMMNLFTMKEIFGFNFGIVNDYVTYEPFNPRNIMEKINRRIDTIETQLGREMQQDEVVILTVAWKINMRRHEFNILVSKDGSGIIADANGQTTEDFSIVDDHQRSGVGHIGLIHTEGFNINTGYEAHTDLKLALNTYLQRTIEMKVDEPYRQHTVPQLFIENESMPLFISTNEDAHEISLKSHQVMNDIVYDYMSTLQWLTDGTILGELIPMVINRESFALFIAGLFFVVNVKYNGGRSVRKSKKTRKKLI